MKRWAALILLLLLSLPVVAEDPARLRGLLENAPEADRARILNELAEALFVSQPEESALEAKRALEVAQRLRQGDEELRAYVNLFQALTKVGRGSEVRSDADMLVQLSERTKNIRLKADALRTVATLMRRSYDEKRTEELLNRAMELYSEAGDLKGYAAALYGVGTVKYNVGEYSESLELSLKAAEIQEQIGDVAGMAASYNGIGAIWKSFNNKEKSLEYHFKSLKLRQELGDSHGEALSLDNIGNTYSNAGEHRLALDYHLRSLEVAERIQNPLRVSSALNNAGIDYEQLGQYEKALECHLRSLKIREQRKESSGIAFSSRSAGSVLLKLGRVDEGMTYLKRAISIAETLQSRQILLDSYAAMSRAYEQKSDFQNALLYERKRAQLKDRIAGEENSKRIAELQTRYEASKRNREIESLKAANMLQQMQRNLLLWGLVVAFLLVVIFAYLYRAKRKSEERLRRTNEAITLKNLEIERSNLQIARQRDEIEAQKNYLLDSIGYAEQIQKAILPTHTTLESLFNDHFIFYQPKDIVSGDFYWVQEVNELVVVAVADCTGHGVPGALMAMIGDSLLKQIVLGQQFTQPAVILEELHIGVQKALSQHRTGAISRDGMDIALCVIDRVSRRLSFAGARRPLYWAGSDHLLKEVKGDRMGIGGKQRVQRTFTEHSVEFDGVLTLYLASDGFADQNDPQGKKYGSRRLKEFLAAQITLSMNDQLQKVSQELSGHQQNETQRDDITILGLRLGYCHL